MKKLDLVGQRYGRLTVIREAGRKYRQVAWECVCDCGGTTVVCGGSLQYGATTSCGCTRLERTVAANSTHGMSKSKEYGIWCKMWERCTNPKATGYKNYGERGITVCPEWRDFTVFYKDLGPCPVNHSIDRVNNDEGYSASNCVWADALQQAVNTRKVKNSATGIAGVHRHREGQYHARIKINGVIHNLGSFKTIEEAARYRREAEQFFRSSRSLSDTSIEVSATP